MMKACSRTLQFAFLSVLLVISCSAQTTAPTDQLLKGPFEFTTEWQTIELTKPLDTLPHIQLLEILLNVEEYEYYKNVPVSENRIISGSFVKLNGETAIKPEVMLVEKSGIEYITTYQSIGTAFTAQGNYRALGYGASASAFYFPRDAKFIKIKIRSNIAFQAEYLSWIAPGYEKWPDRKWDDIDSSKIVNFE